MKDSLCCCVCLKEEPFENNPIVSCDGKNCSTTVHKACYGIQQIPDGAWFCQKCISQERTARVRCELCPSRDGALKHTNKGGWCHIICALFVPGAEFLDPDRLETISVDKVVSDKLNKMCTICEKNNRLDRAMIGACIQCVKSGCKTLFHVTCAQSQGLLTEIVSSKDGVRYVAYCYGHKHKTKHRDFSIRVANSSHSLSRLDKNKLRQTPPQLEKSDEDCVTPQDVSLDYTDTSVSSKTLNVSSSSGNANASSDSTSFDDSVDRIAPVICSSSEISQFSGKKHFHKLSSAASSSTRKSSASDVLRPPNIAAFEPPSCGDPGSLPPNLCCSDASESVAKEEMTVKSSTTGSVTSDASGHRSVKRQATTSSSEIIQPKRQKIPKSEPKTVIKSEMTVAKSEKSKKPKKAPQASIKPSTHTELEIRKDKKPVPPSRPTSIFNHMSSIMGGTSSSGASSGLSTSTTNISGTTSSTSKMTGSTCQSMEELLEWQWDQTGTLLMQQAEASDIASLLSCLHDLKNENEQLLSKQFKLSHRRDHLKAVNAKLQLQLSTKTAATAISCSSSLLGNQPPTNIVDSRLVGRQQQPPYSNTNITGTTCGTQSLPKASVAKSAQKTSDFQASSHFKPAVMPGTLNGGEVKNRQMSESSKPMYIQSQPHQGQMIPNSGWGTVQAMQKPSEPPLTQQQPMNQQTLSLLKHHHQHYQPQQHPGLGANVVTSQPMTSTTGPVSNMISQTDLVTFLNNQLHSQLATSTQNAAISQDVHVGSNNGSNMDLIYQAIQQKKQQQQQHLQHQHQHQHQQQHNLPPHYYYNTNKVGTGMGGVIGNLEGSIPQQTPDKATHCYKLGHQRARPNESLCHQIRSAKHNF